MCFLPESTWTPPRPDCPHPELWHATDDLATEREVADLVAAMTVALRPGIVVETGAHTGTTTARIGMALAEAGRGHLHSLEIDPARAEQARLACQGLPVTVHCVDSTHWLPPHACDVDMLWLDSEPHLRALEIERLSPWMNQRTVIGVHDTGPQHVTRKFLDELEARGVISTPLYLPTPRGVAWMMLANEHGEG